VKIIMRKAQESTGEGIAVKIATFGGQTAEVFLAEDSTVADALTAGGYPAGSEVRVNGEPVSSSDIVDDGDRLLVVAQIKPKGGMSVN
jgi:sulfur carrier protein ThiS